MLRNITDAAYHCTKYVLVPIRAEFLASIGFPLLQRSIEAFRNRYDDHKIEVCGLVFNDYVRQNTKREHKLAREDVMRKATEYGWHVFSKDSARCGNSVSVVMQAGGSVIGAKGRTRVKRADGWRTNVSAVRRARPGNQAPMASHRT